jgi:NaMN:DMB phosphoribosyltransferase
MPEDLKKLADENWKLYQETIFQLNAVKKQREDALLQLGDKDEELSIRARMIQEYQIQIDALVKALREIAQMGSVCKDFENCSHPPCQDSCGAVLVALEALTPHPAPPCPPAPRAPVAETRVDDGGGK